MLGGRPLERLVALAVALGALPFWVFFARRPLAGSAAASSEDAG